MAIVAKGGARKITVSQKSGVIPKFGAGKGAATQKGGAIQQKKPVFVQKPQFVKQSQDWSSSWSSGKGKGNGKGFGKNTGKGGSGHALPANFKVNEKTKYKGTVANFWKFNGYGFIALEQEGVVPNDKVFALWQDINSGDRFPQLYKNMEVEFTLKIETDKWTSQRKLKAKNISLPGGEPVELQDNLDAEKKEFIGGQFLRYTGNLKFYKAKEGYGYIELDDGFVLDESVPKEIRCEMAEMNAGGKKPGNMKEVTEVEFGIWKSPKGVHKAYNVTLPGGVPLPEWEIRTE